MVRRLRWMITPTSAALAVIALLWMLGWSQSTMAAGATFHVDPGGSDSNTCGEAATPCRTIKFAVETRAAEGDTVLVAAGTYTEQFNLQPDVDVRSASGPAATFIDGEDVRGPMIWALNIPVTQKAELEGFTVTRSNNTGMEVNGASLLISDCVFEENTGNAGGGINIRGAGVIVSVQASEFFSNTSGDGGGIWVADGAELVVTDSMIAYNRANSWGGGILGSVGSRVEVQGSSFKYNHAGNPPAFTGYGGGILVDQGTDLLVSDSEFISNTAGNGGAMWVASGSTARIVDSVIALNHVSGSGGGVFGDYATLIEVEGSRFEANHAGNPPSQTGFGGGLIVNNGVALAVSASEFLSNTAGQGAGIDIWNSPRFTLTTVTVMGNKADGKGGIDTDYSSGIISDCLIIGNEATKDRGGGMMSSNGVVTITATTFRENTSNANACGGADLRNQNTLIVDSVFEGNEANTGTALCVMGARTEIRGSEFRNNEGSGAALRIEEEGYALITKSWLQGNTGGAILATGQSRADIANNYIVSNPSLTRSGQVRIEGSSTMTLTHNTLAGDGTDHGVRILSSGANVIANNIVAGQVNGIDFTPPATATLRSNLLWDNNVDHGNGGPGTDDVYLSPDFVDAPNDDYRLGLFSAAVDEASDVASVDEDYDGDPRPLPGFVGGSAAADIGADERTEQSNRTVLPQLVAPE